jgi:dTDP-4-dehydrorhamnose reductase
MKIGFVGANSQVATELCLLLANRDDATVVPIVRNRLGSHLLRHHDLDCRIADITDPEEAPETLADLDIVVVAAFAWQYSHEGFQAQGARKANEALVQNAVDYSSSDARIIYFSSQAAFGDKIGAPQYSDWSLYTREKRNAEKLLKKRCESTGKPGYAFRLGFVHGVNQARTTELRETVLEHAHIHLSVDPEKPSNVVYTVTLLDAILECGRENLEPGRYSIVNEPQWTWKDVCEYYKPDNVTLHFHPPNGGGGSLGIALSRVWKLIESHERALRTLTVYIPDAVNEFLFHKYLQEQRGGELSELQNRTIVERPAFRFNPIPGPYIDGLPKTRQRLEALEAISDLFEHSDQR